MNRLLQAEKDFETKHHFNKMFEENLPIWSEAVRKELLIIECQNRWELFRILKPKQYIKNLQLHIADLENEITENKQKQEQAYRNDKFLYDFSLERIGKELAKYQTEAQRYNWAHKSKASKNATDEITNADIEAAKATPIAQVFVGDLRRIGARMRGKCPFHNEKTPSFIVFPNNRWYCFGACADGGDVVDFVMKLNNLKFLEAVRFLKSA
jgi:hypothetical protein